MGSRLEGDHPSFSGPQRVAICVCTYGRPQMLDRCLRSLAGQVIDKTIDLHIVVVDNEDGPNNHDAVKAGFVDVWTAPRFHYVHEPRRGIACARNAALDKGMEIEADWIAFIDDDEVAAADWIAQLMAPEYLETPILLGAIVHDYPDPAPFWVTGRRQATVPRGREGQRLKTGTTGNVRLSAELVRLGMRFDESLGLMGGEDNELFTRVAKAGFEIRRTMRAIVTEAGHPERMTYRGQMYRAYWCAASDMRRAAIRSGWAGAMLRKSHTVPLNILFGAVEIAVSPLFIVLGLDAFKRRALAGGKKIAKGLGRAAAMTGRLPEPYRNIAGN